MGALVITPFIEGGSSEEFVGRDKLKKYLICKKTLMAYESLARLKSTFLDISYLLCVLHCDMCPFCPNHVFGAHGPVAPPPPISPCLSSFFSRSGRLVMPGEHRNCSFRFKIRAFIYLSINQVTCLPNPADPIRFAG